eukprot:m.291661 g.291661  ORF g.291661 m.291661 type:complete len:378 (-) comp19982_c0_seq2:439-1572(-)
MGRIVNFAECMFCVLFMSIAGSPEPESDLARIASDTRKFHACTPYMGNNVSEALLKQLGAASEAFYEVNVNFTLFAGTLLGAIRNNGINPYEVDCDIMVDENFTITDSIQAALHARGLHAFWYKGNIRICNRQQNRVAVKASQAHLEPINFELLHRPWIDLYRYTCCCACWEHGPKLVNKISASRTKIPQSAAVHECCTQKAVPKPERKAIGGIVTNVPQRALATAILKHFYGDWKQPPSGDMIDEDIVYFFTDETSPKMKKENIRQMYRNRRKYNICGEVVQVAGPEVDSEHEIKLVLDLNSISGILTMVTEVHPQSKSLIEVEKCAMIFGELGFPITTAELQRAVAGQETPSGIPITTCIATVERFLGVWCSNQS